MMDLKIVTYIHIYNIYVCVYRYIYICMYMYTYLQSGNAKGKKKEVQELSKILFMEMKLLKNGLEFYYAFEC